MYAAAHHAMGVVSCAVEHGELWSPKSDVEDHYL